MLRYFKLSFRFLLAFAFVSSIPLHGQLLFSPASKADSQSFELGFGGGLLKSDYEVKAFGDKDSGEVKRTLVFGSLAFGVNEYVDLIGAAGFIPKAEVEGFADDDTGFILGLGLRSKVWQQDQSSVHLYGQVSYFDEDYGTEPETWEYWAWDLSASGTELTVGALYVHTLESVRVYGGLELVPFSDVEVSLREYGTDFYGPYDQSFKFDAERDDLISMKIGALFDIGAFDLMADLNFAGETFFRFGIVKGF